MESGLDRSSLVYCNGKAPITAFFKWVRYGAEAWGFVRHPYLPPHLIEMGNIGFVINRGCR